MFTEIVPDNSLIFPMLLALSLIANLVLLYLYMRAKPRPELTLDDTIDAMPSLYVGINEQGLIYHWNQALEARTKISKADAIGSSLFKCLPNLGISKAMIEDVIRFQRHQKIEAVNFQTQDDNAYFDITLCWVNTQSPVKVLIRLDDMTDRINMENLMVQNEKMLSMSELAAGMAHEINNPLSAILQSVQNIFRRCSSDIERNHRVARELDTDLDKINQFLNQRECFKFLCHIKESGENAMHIINNMLEFSRKSPSIKQMVNITKLCQSCIDFAKDKQDLKAIIELQKIHIQVTQTAHLPDLYCNKSEMQQVFSNLIRNSIQAIASANAVLLRTHGGTLDIQLSCEKNIFQILIRDDGVGINQDAITQLFKPFYSTKQNSGYGLGLAVSYFIITNHHNGSIDVTSKPKQGTCFKIRVPLAEGPRKTSAHLKKKHPSNNEQNPTISNQTEPFI